jgi:hypothetical protein
MLDQSFWTLSNQPSAAVFSSENICLPNIFYAAITIYYALLTRLTFGIIERTKLRRNFFSNANSTA